MSVNNDKILIDREDIETAQCVSGNIADRECRGRAAANVLAARAAGKYFQDIEADVESGIHNIPSILKNIDISDIYVRDNYIDVRVFFNENELCVPKRHFDLDILPVAYMFIRFSEDLSAGEIVGFMFPEDINTDSDVGGYYFVQEDDLKSAYDVEARLATVEDEDYDSAFEKEVYDYLDGKEVDEQSFYKHLLNSNSSRIYMQNTSKAYDIFSEMQSGTSQKEEEVIYNMNSAPKNVQEDDTEETSELELHTDDDSVSLLEEVSDSGNNLLEEVGQLDILETTDGGGLLEDDGLTNQDELIDMTLPEDDSMTEQTDNSSEDLPAEDNEEVTVPESDNSSNDDILQEDSENLTIFDAEESEELLPPEEDNTQDNVAETIDSIPDYTVETLPEEPVQDANEETEEPVKKSEEPDEFDELSKFDYSTEIEPSITSIETGSAAENETSDAITEEMLETFDSILDSEKPEQEVNKENEEQIDTLFDNGPAVVNTSKKKKGSALPLLGILVVAGALGYFGYTKYFGTMPPFLNNTNAPAGLTTATQPEEKDTQNQVAMPIETVENTEAPKNGNEAVSVSIPAIEQNLGASIEVSNLTVNWEVPLAYANNATAKRYFVKIGKVLQLKLKTELLLVSSPPITNKITIELEFNKSANRFEISKMTNSSGVEVVDSVIKDTVSKTLGMNMSTNMSVFSNLQGNPVLIIKL